ncbi:MAG: SDR family oxidoreductase [Thermoleophilaceae bacterium]|nr:SDR family oxidoreductase [Thermoleophilaceae bacterium]
MVGRAAVITGAASGIGLACAEKFAAAGWGLVLVGRSVTVLDAVAARVGREATPVCGDVAIASTSRQAVAAALERFGRLDAVVGNAGVTLAKSVDDTTELELEHLIAVNVKGLVYLAQASHAALGRSRGSFIVMASNKGLVAQRRSPIYVATKGAAVQLARALALDWAPEGIRVNALCPGLVDTPMLEAFLSELPNPELARRELTAEQPLGRLARAGECADVALFLASPASSFVSGVALPVDGGFTAQ